MLVNNRRAKRCEVGRGYRCKNHVCRPEEGLVFPVPALELLADFVKVPVNIRLQAASNFYGINFVVCHTLYFVPHGFGQGVLSTDGNFCFRVLHTCTQILSYPRNEMLVQAPSIRSIELFVIVGVSFHFIQSFGKRFY